jgi:ankyrin repeat protein
MDGIWRAASEGDLAEVERLVGHDQGLLNARDAHGQTPLMYASREGHVGVVRWLLDQEAAINEQDAEGCTALWLASSYGRLAVVKLLLRRGADLTIVGQCGQTPLIIASSRGHLEVVRFLLGHPSGKANINHRADQSRTALWWACYTGRGGVARALLDSGADPTIADSNSTAPVHIALGEPPLTFMEEGRRECVAALQVR